MGSWLEGHPALQGLAEALFRAGLSWPFNMAPLGAWCGPRGRGPTSGGC